MNTLSSKMASILERLAEMFPKQSYQSRLEMYLCTKHITDIAQLEYYTKQFENRNRGHYL